MLLTPTRADTEGGAQPALQPAVCAPRRPRSPEPVDSVRVPLRCSSQRDADGSWTASTVLPQTHSFLWPEPSPGHKLSTPPTHLSFLKVRPWAPGLRCRSQPCPSLRLGRSPEAQKREERTMKGFHSRRLPAVSPASSRHSDRTLEPIKSRACKVIIVRRY